ncbi:MAG: hypothetical protein QM739_02780 [Propionivibrio sp.]
MRDWSRLSASVPFVELVDGQVSTVAGEQQLQYSRPNVRLIVND